MKNPQHILITGASSGIGEALAIHYAAKDTVLFLCGQNADRVQAVKQACEAKGAVVYAEQIDVTDEKQTADWITRCDETAPLDLVIANAGVSAGPGDGNIESADRKSVV